jgi:ADP-ribose pyrophosphatase
VTQAPQEDAIPEVTAGRRVYEGWLNVRLDSLRYASGRDGDITFIEHPGAVTMVAIDGQGLVLFVRQYRHAIGRWLLELPAGGLEPGEDPAACAERELQEETGYRPGRLEKLGAFYLAPGYSSEYEHVYLASELTESKLEGDEDVIHVERLSIEEALRRVRDGEIEDAKTAAALLLYLRHAGNKGTAEVS